SALDMLLGPRAGQAPAIEAPFDAGAADTGIDDDASHGDPVSYGEETGYVHPDSYRDEGEYTPHGDSGGPGGSTGSGYPCQDEPAGDGHPAGHCQARVTSAVATAAMPSPRPVRPSPSVVVPDTLTGAPPRASDSTFCASSRRGAIRGAFPITWIATLPTANPAPASSAA